MHAGRAFPEKEMASAKALQHNHRELIGWYDWEAASSSVRGGK